MKITAFVHFSVPYRNAGSETMLQTLLEALALRGHDVSVVATDIPEAPPTTILNGVTIHSMPTPTAEVFLRSQRPDVIITHHQRIPNTVKLARELKSKWVFLVHNDDPGQLKYLSCTPDLVVFNTEWIAEKVNNPNLNAIICHPPVWPDRHATTPGDCITLVNLNEHKGGLIVQELARRMPGENFLGVVGGHGVQIRPSGIPNFEVVEPTQDMRTDVWSRTRILLVPSAYESYGMVGVEAMASGIPVIASPTPGLLESLSYAGTFAPRYDLDGWETAIRTVQAHWDSKSAISMQRSMELHPQHELDFFVENIENLTSPGGDLNAIPVAIGRTS